RRKRSKGGTAIAALAGTQTGPIRCGSSRARGGGRFLGAVELLQRILDVDAGVTRLARVRPRAWWWSLLIGVAAAVLMLLVRAALSAFYADVTGFMILLPAVIVAALAGGRTAGLTALVACLFGGWVVVGWDAVGAGVSNRLGVIAT